MIAMTVEVAVGTEAEAVTVRVNKVKGRGQRMDARIEVHAAILVGVVAMAEVMLKVGGGNPLMAIKKLMEHKTLQESNLTQWAERRTAPIM